LRSEDDRHGLLIGFEFPHQKLGAGLDDPSAILI